MKMPVKMFTKRAQVSAEFSIVLIYVLMVFFIILFISVSQENVLKSIKDDYEASAVATKLSSVINNIYLAGDGAHVNVSIALTSDYNITVQDRYLSVQKASAIIGKTLLTNRTNFTSINTNSFIIKIFMCN